MAPDIRATHYRLETWARWTRDTVPNDWPRRTILGRVIDEGPGASHIRTVPPPLPELVAKTDVAVARLPPDDRQVIREYYLRWQPRELVARRLRMPITRFDATLNRARWRVCGFLSAFD